MKNIAIVGMGKMGSAIESRIAGDYTVTAVGRNDSLELIENADTVILAVKPQTFKGDKDRNVVGLGEKMWPHVTDQLFVSVMAGVDLLWLQQSLGTKRVVRAMTSLAVARGEGNTVWCSKDDSVDTESVDALFSKMGRSERIANEALMDAFTGVFGCGPGFVFKFLSYLERQAVERGFDAQQAREMSQQMLVGATSQLRPEISFDELANQVASPGGATEAGFKVFEIRRQEDIVREAVGAACLRSQELGRG
jgi:pyrroline-5-carboxylate reductase